MASIDIKNDVEEGELSDSVWIEESNAEDFNQEPRKNSNKDLVKSTSTSKRERDVSGRQSEQQLRVYTMEELYKTYPDYARRLYNYAWSQAVQNKPLNERFEPESSTASSSASSSGKNDGKANEVEKSVSGDNSEDGGELEEGEIGSGSELGDGDFGRDDPMNADSEMGNDVNVSGSDNEGFEASLKSVRDALESVTGAEVEKSFQEVCQCIQNALEKLHELGLKNSESAMEGLDQTVLSSIRVVNSVLYSMDSDKKQHKDMFIRLLSHVMSCDPPLLSPKQLNEIELMLLSWKSISSLFSSSASEKQMPVDELSKQGNGSSAIVSGHGLNSLNKPPLNFETVALPAINDVNMSLESLKPGLSSLKVRGGLPLLLDLHKDYDVDSLPSPTRGAPMQLPIYKSPSTGAASKMVHPGMMNSKEGRSSEDLALRIYENDTLKAFSSYQQKFCQNQFSVSDRLPSPTPSDDAKIGDAETSGEVSSLPVADNNKPLTPTVSCREVVYSTPCIDRSYVQELNDSRIAAATILGPIATSRGPRKINDPRLQFATSNKGPLDLKQHPLPGVKNAALTDSTVEIVSSKKHKLNEEPLNGPGLKRQRNGLVNPMADNNWKIAHGNSRLGEIKAPKPTFTSREQLKENADAQNGVMEICNGSFRSSTGSGVDCVSGTGGWLEETIDAVPNSMNKACPLEDTNMKDKAYKEILNDAIMSSASCGGSTVGTSNKPSFAVSGNGQLPVLGFGSTASLPDLLNNIAVNPSILINLVTNNQQSMGSEGQHTAASASNCTAISTSNPVLGAVSAVNLPPLNSIGLMQKPLGTLPVSSQTTSLIDSGKMRMKPRDPRRALHVNAPQKNGTSITNNQEMKENTSTLKWDDLVDKKPRMSQPGQTPNITQQSTKNLKNSADSVLSSQVTSSSTTTIPRFSQLGSKSDKEVMRPAVSRAPEQQRTGSATELGVVGSRSQNTWADVEHLLEGYDEQQKAAIQRERARRIEEQKKMFAARKLCLVLDLDHTLLNSAKFSEIDPAHEEILRKKEEQDREKPQRHLFRFAHMNMWTKLRPGVWNFLEKASQLFELHLYTMGNKVYATEMAKVLDPKGTLFAGRVMSRGDDGDFFDGDERVPRSKDLEGVLGMESAVVIIDDSIKVWPHNKPNLIVVERYTYFPCSRRQFGLMGPSLLEIDHDERPEAGTLASSLAVIERLHQSFFSHTSLDDVDVRAILAEEQRKILAGCCIVFSRVFPVGEANPHLHPLWQTAEQFGAICTTQLSEQVTHVVANALGTDKVNWALSRGRFVVNPGWVEASALLYRRANEADFAIKQ